MQCPACSFQNRPEARFCYHCGRELAQWVQAGVIPAPSSQRSTPSAGPGGSGWQPSTPSGSPEPADPAAGLFPPPGTPPAQSRGSGGFKARGTARMVQFRSEISDQILELLLEQYDSSGNRALLPVEMRGRSIGGVINDGDEVEVSGRWKNGLLHTTKIYNRTTSSLVKAKTSRLSRAFMTGCAVIFLLVFILFVVVWFEVASHISGGLPH